MENCQASCATVHTVSETPRPWVVYCDGSAIPNAGRMGIGAVIIEPGGTRHTLSRAMTTRGCNNEAELGALMAALLELHARGANTLRVYSDSTLLVEQLVGANAKPVARLAPLFEEARALLNTFAHASLQWIPGHRNGEADALARSALGMLPRVTKKKRT